MFIIDIIINFWMMFLDNVLEVVISELKKIVIYYFKMWFVVDFVVVILFDFFILVGVKGVGINKLNELWYYYV